MLEFLVSLKKGHVIYVLFAIFAAGFLIRVWGIGSAEIFHDEGLYAFRSIGYLDYVQNDDQSTPIQWFKDKTLPWWTHLSFHDHPPLFFIVQWASFHLLGDSLFAARLPSLIAGVASIWLIFLVIRLFLLKSNFNRSIAEAGGLFAALLLAVNHIHIWISRSGIFESLLILFMLASIYFFLKFLEDISYWKWFGIFVGLSMLTKYTSIFLIPVFLGYLAWSHRDYFKAQQLYGAVLLATLIFSPVIIYNIFLFKEVNHFDLQFAYLFDQKTPEWRASFGKTQDPFSLIFLNLSAMYSIPFLLVTLWGGIVSLFILLKKQKEQLPLVVFALFVFLANTILLVVVGSAFRFLTLYLFSFILFALIGVIFLRKWLGARLFALVLIIFLFGELAFSIDGIFREFPDFGVASLDRLLQEELGNTRSLALPKSPNPHLDTVIQRYTSRLPFGTRRIMIIYDDNIALSERLWLFSRRMYYHGIPSITPMLFKNLIQERGISDFVGYDVYFIKASSYTDLNRHFSTQDAVNFEIFLQKELNLSPMTTVYGYQHLPMFFVYKFTL